MPKLSIKCATCHKLIPTGLDMDYETFRGLTYSERTIECPNCDQLQTWNLDDVDRSVFAKPSK